MCPPQEFCTDRDFCCLYRSLTAQEKGSQMAFSGSKTWQRGIPEVFSPDLRPGADTYVYCKGCGQPLERRDRFTRPKPSVSCMMCESCREMHGHDLVPTPGAPTFCYRCGGPDELFVAE